MTEFIYNCYLWVASNYKEITMVLTSTQFLSIVSALVLLVRSIRKTDNNVVASKVLTEQLEKNEDNAKVVKEIKTELDTIKNENTVLQQELSDSKESIDILLSKINAMLEVQSVVYSTIKNETVRETVDNILINAKYAETKTRAKLKKEVEELKVKVAEKFDTVMEDVNKTVNVVNSVVADKKEDTITRY